MKRIALLLCLICFFFCCVSAFADEKVKYPNVSGQFYPSSKESLSSQIDNFFEKVKFDSDLADKDILAIISPHAGYIYSGQVAAYGFKAVKDRKYDTVIVLAPSHSFAFKGVSVYREGFLNTPLGNIQIDEELADSLISFYQKADFIPEAFNREHSLEVELPFLQKALGNFKIVPIICGQLDYADTGDLTEAIIKISQGEKVLVVVSTDLSHYHPYLTALEMDSKVISHIKELDALGLWQSNLKGESEACGITPVLVLLNYAKNLGLKAEVLNYANSGDVTGDKSRVVGYVSAIFFKEDSSQLQPQDLNSGVGVLKGEEEMLNETQKKRLLEIARQSISEYLSTGKLPNFKEDDAVLNLKRGAFVTLHKGGNLRGCIGSFTSSEPLYQVISKMAVESATGDPRFRPVEKEELDDIKIEISVLTEPQLISDWRKIRLGTDGVILRRGFSSGVFLPQVATETGWDLETFLSELCRQKAGLSSDAYKDSNTQLYTFQAYVFSEE